jgi:hypothetical protein
MSTPLRDQVITPVLRFNVRGFQDDDAPWPQWDTSIPEDLKGEADTLQVLSLALPALEQAGFPIDGDEIATRYNLPLRKGEKYEAPERVGPIDPNTVPPQDGGKPPAKKDATKTKAKAKASHECQVPLMIDTHSGVPIAADSGFVSGQAYADDLVDNARAAAGRAIEQGLLKELVDEMKDVEDWDGLRKAVLKVYGATQPPEALRATLQKALVLADLAGAAAVRQDST